jgi:hypothetical protein
LLNFWKKKESPEVVIPQPSATELHIQSLQSEITFLREQVKLLQDRTTPQAFVPRVVTPMRPQKWDVTAQKYIPKTDAEIESDKQGLRELGLI